MTRFFAPTVFLVTLLVVNAGEAAADIYMYKDKQGVTHFTNIKPQRGRFQRLYKTGPGKAARKRCSGCDVVPAKDSSAARFSRYDKFIYSAAQLYKIPVALIRAVMESESDYDPRVVSSAGAKGLMQLMPATARKMGVTDVFDPRQNIYGGTRYLRVMANTFNGNLVLTVAGYHAGPTAVSRYRGIPPYVTTHKYVRLVIRRYYKYQKREAVRPKGAALPPPSSQTSPRRVPASRAVGE
ncbi:MAG: lytic transglycosylase domain-containing protein [bacterium]